MSSNQSIKRAFSILKTVAAYDQGVGVTEIANQIELHKSTVSRMLATLEEVGAVERLDNGDGFRIGNEIVALAGQVSPTRQLITIARPFLHQLSEATGETINLCIPEGDLARYIEQIDSRYNLQIKDWVGKRIPLHACCDGKLFLAYRSKTYIDQYLAQPLQRFSPNTITNPDKLRSHLNEIQTQGHAWTHGEYEAEIMGISTPIWGSDDEIVASLCVGGPSFRFPTDDKAERLIQLMKNLSQQISDQLGHR